MKKALFGGRNPCGPFFLFLGRKIGINVVFADQLTIKRRYHGREWLRRPRLFVRHITGGHRPLFDGPKRLTRYPVEYKKESMLGSNRYRIDFFAAVVYRNELRRCRKVIIPDVVMNRLKMPKPFAGTGIQCEDAISKQITAGAVCAIVVVGRRPQRKIGDTAV